MPPPDLAGESRGRPGGRRAPEKSAQRKVSFRNSNSNSNSSSILFVKSLSPVSVNNTLLQKRRPLAR